MIAFFGAAIAMAQSDGSRKAADYPAHASWAHFDIGAENLGHTIPADPDPLFARDYLVIEIAIFPSAQPITLSSAAFSLCVNGTKGVLFPESPGFVAASLKYPDWEKRPALIGTVEKGDGSVIVGAPPHVGRFPGDPNGNPRIDMPRQEPDARPKPSAEDLVARAALPEGGTSKPVKGCLFFAFKGKLKSIHKLELVFDGKESLTLAPL